MNRNKIYLLSVLAVLSLSSCMESNEPGFELDTDSIEIDAAGGQVRVMLESPDSWVAKTQNPWITDRFGLKCEPERRSGEN